MYRVPIDFPSRRRRRLATCLAFCIAAAAAPAAQGNILHVTNCDDDGSAGSLRVVVGGAANNDTVQLDVNQLACHSIGLEFGLYVGVDNLAIINTSNAPMDIGVGTLGENVITHGGVGRLSLIGLNISGGRIQDVGGCISSNGSLYLSGTTVSDCEGADKGGAVYAAYDLELVGSRITGSTVDAHVTSRGGGAYVGRDLTLSDESTISGNRATSYAGVLGHGGGAYVKSSVSILSSTISGNTAATGGGIYALNAGTGTLIDNSTISGNIADGAAGAIIGGNRTTLYNSTIAFNQTKLAHPSSICRDSAICAYSQSSGVAPRIFNTIIANNTNMTGANNADLYVTQPNGVGGSLPTGSNNLIVSANFTPQGTLTSDPQLAPLADNGGLTLTHALAKTSPAIDAGATNPDVSLDERGFPRVSGPRSDIGAYEFDEDTIFKNGFQ